MSSRPSDFSLTRPGPFRLYRTAELLRLPPPDWLIDGVLPQSALVVLYGAPGHGKTFLALAWALAVAAGGQWTGRAVERGTVIYVSAEGGPGIGKRVQAWLQHFGVEASDLDVAWLTEAITLNPESDSTDVDVLMRRIDDELMAIPSLVVLDTLARTFEGDENQQKDMGRFVTAVDRFRHQYGSTVVVVHHTGLAGDRERGSTSLRGAADTMIRCDQASDGTITVSCAKQKDDEPFPNLQFHLRQLRVGIDAKRRPITSCVLVHPDKAMSVQHAETAILDTLASATEPLTPAQLAACLSVPRRTLFRALKRLLALHKIINEYGHYSLSRVPAEMRGTVVK